MFGAAGADDLGRLGPLEVVWFPADGSAPMDVSLDVAAQGTIGQLRATLDGRPGDLQIDGRVWPAPAHVAAAGVRRGARIRPGETPPRPLREGAVAELHIVAGLRAGRRWPLTPGSYVLGRAADCDLTIPAPSVSAHHAVLAVDGSGAATLTDLGATNGVRVDGEFISGTAPVPPEVLVHLGAIVVCLRTPVPADRLAPEVLNRPPRHPLPQGPAAIRLPDGAKERAPRARLAWAAMLAPLVLGVVMALLYDPRFALFALFSPAMMLGTWAEDRRRARREGREGREHVAAGVAVLSAELAAAAQQQRAAAHSLLGDPGLAVSRLTTSRLWERRPGQPDFLRVSLGVGTVAWEPAVVTPQVAPDPSALAVVDAHRSLAHAAVPVDLGGSSVVGLCGTRVAAIALARGLVLQAAGTSGPADLRVAVLTQPDRAQEWDWVKWLPHSSGPHGSAAGRQIAVTPTAAAELVDTLIETGAAAVTLVVVDADGMTQGREAPARRLLGHPGCGAVVVAPTVQQLPAVCTAVVELEGEDGRARVTRPTGGPGCDDLLVAGVEPAVGREAALQLAAIDDPEVADSQGRLPADVALLQLLALTAPTAAELRRRWDAGADPVVPIGVGEGGPVLLDLEADGPHGLIAGTTGAGKSELLRTIVAGLAATLGPDELTFVLIDYKGGSAFDVCARLPHTVGLVTDLDEQLGRRALQCLEAELRYRERLLRDAGATDLAAFRQRVAAGTAQPLPRLLVAVDEFATLAAELPEFIDRLVSVAQRGRSLGVHLLLATQRPAGAVSDNIRANTNLRIALRVQDVADSNDVLGSPVAAELTRRLPGRGYLRLGPGDITGFQAAMVTGSSPEDAPPVVVRPFAPGLAPRAAVGRSDNDSDLARLVAAACAAFAGTGQPLPRRPWPVPLPHELPLDDLPPDAIGLRDEPDEQRQTPYAFDPAKGNLLLYGVAGSGATAALATIALRLAARCDVDCYVLDAGSQALASLAGLANVGAVVGAGERERQERLVRLLADDLAARRRAVAATGTLPPGTPTTVVLVDSYAAFSAGLDDVHGMAVLDTFARVVADGPALGIVVVASTDRVTGVPPAVAATIPQRLVFGLSDRHDYGAFGLRPGEVGDLPRNRAVEAATGYHVQIAEPADGLAAAVAAAAANPSVAGRRRPRPVGAMPDSVPLAEVVDAARIDGDWFLPLGLGDRTLTASGLHLGPGDHALITGPARSGKSTCLLAIAETVAKHRPDVLVVAAALRRSPLTASAYLAGLAATEAELADVIDDLRRAAGPVLLLVDDADATTDPAGALAALLAERRDTLRVIGAGRPDVLRTAYGHWTAELRRSRQGLALRPNLDMDGDLWHTALPRRDRGPWLPGRGYLVADGAAELLQAATP